MAESFFLRSLVKTTPESSRNCDCEAALCSLRSKLGGTTITFRPYIRGERFFYCTKLKEEDYVKNDFTGWFGKRS